MYATPLNIGTSQNNIATWSLPFAQSTALKLSANTPVNVTIPDNATDALIQLEPGIDIFVGTEPLTIPTDSNPIEVTYRQNPEFIKVKGYSTLYLQTKTDSVVTIGWYDNNQGL